MLLLTGAQRNEVTPVLEGCRWRQLGGDRHVVGAFSLVTS
jgi:hypothetical protein